MSGFQGSRVPGLEGFQDLKGLKDIEGPKVSRSQGFKGFKGTIFSLSKLNYAQRHRACT